MTDTGRPYLAPGVVFSEDTAVSPDIVWVAGSRLRDVLGDDGKLHGAPDLVVEVLSAGKANVERDRKSKLALYGSRGVREYWIVDWREQTVEVLRRFGSELALVAVPGAADGLESLLLAGFSMPVEAVFEP